ncbi:MAG TPA: threonine synthase [bacterium]|nr:threonine synthase [bacterium]
MIQHSLLCTSCRREYPFGEIRLRCQQCGEPLELPKVSDGAINVADSLTQTMLERYSAFFPFASIDPLLSLGEGFTPLSESPRLSSDLGVRRLLFKNETLNPTWSFKDRGTIAGIQHAAAIGCSRIGTVSTGNMAVSVAAYGARAGMETFVLVSDSIPEEKISPIAIHQPHLIRVNGDYGNLYFESVRIGTDLGIYFLNSDVPLRVEGSKTIAFEICEQLQLQVPDYVIVPTSAGGNLRGIIKGFEEFVLCGLIPRMPTIVCAQASGCAPIFNAWSTGKDSIERVQAPHTIAHAIENPFPPSGNQALRKIREHDGLCIAVSDDAILQAQRTMAREGIFGQPAAAVPLAALRQLRKEGTVTEDATVVCVVTGCGLKYTAALREQPISTTHCTLEQLPSVLASPRA